MAIHRIALLLTLLVAAAHGGLAVATPSALIINTCAAIYKNFSGQVDYRYCQDALSADPAGASAKDTHELAVVAANVSSTVLVLADLVHNLADCLRTYREMNDTLAGALDDFRAGRVHSASEKLRDATDMPDNCDILLFQGSAKKNPMSKEDDDANKLSNIAYGISMEVQHPAHSS
jgi:pectinesterase inhibitor-like protein